MNLYHRTKTLDKLASPWFGLGAFLLLLLALIAEVRAQDFTHTNVEGTITITGYVGPGGAMTIPDTIAGLPVTAIGHSAFYGNANLTSVTIPDNVTSIGDEAFGYCTSLTNVTIGNSVTSIGGRAFEVTSLVSVTIPNSVTSIGEWAFDECFLLHNVTIGESVTSIGGTAFFGTSLTRVAIPNSVTSIGDEAFGYCTSLTNVTIGSSVTSIGDWAFELTSLTSVTIPKSVTSIGDGAFAECDKLTGVYFEGKAPSFDSSVYMFEADRATAYYLPGIMGWSTNFAGLPTALWQPQVQTKDATFGMRNNQFGFNISWASGMTVVVEASTSLAETSWTPVSTNALSNGSFYFTDPHWANFPGRFYRIRSP
jgi:hypothetical protein